MIEVEGTYQQISPSIEEKIEIAEFLGITVEWVEPNEFPKEELQTNYCYYQISK